VRRSGFTLIELLIIIGIIATMVSISVLSVRQGQASARIRGASRDIFALIRQARSIALVSEEPSIITYSNEIIDSEPCAKVEIVSSKKLRVETVDSAETLSGERISFYEGEEQGSPPSDESVDDSAGAVLEEPGGLSTDEVLFEPMSEELLRGIRLKVEPIETVEETSFGRKRQNISVFSNVDYLLGQYSEAKKKEKQNEASLKEDAPSTQEESLEVEEPVRVVWQVNGRCDPHRLWIYPDGKEPEDGIVIEVDVFGVAKVLSVEELK
jgi:type II secretory pathway pseudopilin PulG